MNSCCEPPRSSVDIPNLRDSRRDLVGRPWRTQGFCTGISAARRRCPGGQFQSEPHTHGRRRDLDLKSRTRTSSRKCVGEKAQDGIANGLRRERIVTRDR